MSAWMEEVRGLVVNEEQLAALDRLCGATHCAEHLVALGALCRDTPHNNALCNRIAGFYLQLGEDARVAQYLRPGHWLTPADPRASITHPRVVVPADVAADAARLDEWHAVRELCLQCNCAQPLSATMIQRCEECAHRAEAQKWQAALCSVYQCASSLYNSVARDTQRSILALDLAVQVCPNDSHAAHNLGNAYMAGFRFADAAKHLEVANLTESRTLLVYTYRHLCEWDKADAVLERSMQTWRENPDALVVPAFQAQVWPFRMSERPRASLAYAHAMDRISSPQFDHSAWTLQAGTPVRVGLLSACFRDHPVARLLTGVLAEHDPRLVHITLFSLRSGAYEPEVAQGADDIVDLGSVNSEGVARAVFARNIDVLFWIDGYTHHTTVGVMSQRPAPVQVSFLGYTGTSGVDAMDFLLADRIVTPPEYRHGYSEALAFMPDAYMPLSHRVSNGGVRTVESAQLPAMRAASVEQVLHAHTRVPVVGQFNQLFKVNRPAYSAWMHALHVHERAVLWQLLKPAEARAALEREARALGIDPARLVFSESNTVAVSADEHIERIALSDVVVDTPDFNGHSTSADVLWAGVPLLTLPRETFASRVAASLLINLECPELVAASWGEYEAKLKRLLSDRAHREAMRAKVQHKRSHAPLFDIARWTRNFERTVRLMAEVTALGRRSHHVIPISMIP